MVPLANCAVLDSAMPIHSEILVDVLPACASGVSLECRTVVSNRDTYTSRCLRRMTCSLVSALAVAVVEAVLWTRGATVDLTALMALPRL